MSPEPRITDQGDQSFVWMGLESLQWWRLNRFSGQPSPGLDYTHGDMEGFNFNPFGKSGPPLFWFITIITHPVSKYLHTEPRLCLLSNLSSGTGHLDFPRLPHWHQPTHMKWGPGGDLFQNSLPDLHHHWYTCWLHPSYECDFVPG